ncbi:MAG: polysaccharide biosynthesis/export family protein [Bacteroidota bacterium]
MNRIQTFILLLFIAGAISSCDSYKKLTYLRDIAETGKDSLFTKNKPGYRLQPGDILYIQVVTPNEEINRIFNPLMGSGQGNQNMRQGGQSLYYNGYSISDSGYIEMPIMDTIYVDNITPQEAKDRIRDKADKYLKKAQVIVRLANFRFTLLGEVRQPGVQEVYDNQVNIMEALAYAGDISYNGNRENVLVIRPTGEGSRTFRIDVTDNNLIDSEGYYIQPNDIIYVEPLETTMFRERSSDYMFLLGAVSSILSTTVIVLNLMNR